MGVIAYDVAGEGGYAYGVCDTEFFGFPGTRVISTWGLITNSLGDPPVSGTTYYAAIWSAIVTISLTETPTQYQGVYPKYQIGTWAQLSNGVIIADGFLNYTIQRVCTGIQPLDRDTYGYYNGDNYPQPQPVGEVGSVLTPIARMGSFENFPQQPISDGVSIAGNSSGEGTVQIYYYAVFGPTTDPTAQYLVPLL